MFAVIEKKQNNKAIIGLIENQNKFLEFVKKEINDDNFIYLTNVSLDEIENNKIFKNNKYLINYDDTKLVYAEKIINFDRGFIYNSKKIELNIISSWKLVANKINLQREYYG